ncbi:unnamed protein product [Adineta steineri]|uniref:ABC transporter domain-containing protein n=1 Tax=Adineta steineri TaxID=433720 RepID=A0A814QGN8_9BILA|nr:unnamed protein product [Adineta steineri]
MLTLKSRMSLPRDIALNAIERMNKVFSEKATVFRDEDSHSESMMEQHYAKTVVKRPNLALRIMSWRPDTLCAAIFALYWTLSPLTLGLLYWRALILVENNKIDMSNIVMISAFAMFALQSLNVVGMLANRIGASFASAHAFFDLFDRIPTIDNESNKGKELNNFRGETEFNQVKFIYPSRPTVLVLNKLQLSIKSGQRIALVGASGCGKSTIVQLLERFYDVTHGELILDGVDIRKLNIQWLRSRLGVVSQEPVLFDLTIAENITYGLEHISIDEIILAATKANIHEFIQQLPLVRLVF